MLNRSIIERLRNDGAAVESTLRRINVLAEAGQTLPSPNEKDEALRSIGQLVRGLVSRNVDPDDPNFGKVGT